MLLVDHVGVDAEGDRRVSVPEPGCHHMARDARQEQRRGVDVPEIMSRAWGRGSTPSVSLCALISIAIRDETESGAISPHPVVNTWRLPRPFQDSVAALTALTPELLRFAEYGVFLPKQ